MDRDEQADLRLALRIAFERVPLIFQGGGIGFVLADPRGISVHRCFRDDCRRWLLPAVAQALARAKFRNCAGDAESRAGFSPRMAGALSARQDVKTASAFPARLFRGTQDRFLILYLGLELFDLRFEPIGFRHPVFELFVLGVHDELRFRAIPAESTSKCLGSSVCHSSARA